MWSIETVGFMLDTLGKLLVAYTSLMVHHRFRHEHRVDEDVFTAMRWEQVFGFLGIVMILIGSTMELSAKFG